MTARCPLRGLLRRHRVPEHPQPPGPSLITPAALAEAVATLAAPAYGIDARV